MKPYWTNGVTRLYQADARGIPLADESIHCVVTSPPYFGLRDYGVDGAIGLEATLEEYIDQIVTVFREVWRVLRPDGVAWVNLGDAYAGSGKGMNADGTHSDGDKQATNIGSLAVPLKSKRIPRGQGRWGGGDKPVPGLKRKDLMGLPWHVAFTLQADGWWLRSSIIWAKPNPMPESVRDRPTTAHEYVFLLTKRERYFFDSDAIREQLADASVTRIRQPSFPQQSGGSKDYRNGTNPNRSVRQALENLKDKADKQRGHSRRHDGFNDRWDAMSKEEQQAVGANARTVWTIAPQNYPGAHFATFPEELPRRCILAGASGHGVCAVCGAPWQRGIERTGHVNNREPAHVPHNSPTKTDSTGWAPVKKSSVEWHPTCAHVAPVVPATVLDPFVGSGTTCAVAQSLGRRSVGLDLSQDYLALAVKRISEVPLPMTMGG